MRKGRWVRIAVTRGAAVVVVTVAIASACLAGGPSPPVGRGEQLYTSTCMACHGGATGGGMMDYPPRHNANGHTWHHPDCELRSVIRNGGSPMTEIMRRMMAPRDAPRMPAFKDRLSEDEIDAILTFIKTMWTEDERRYQAQITREAC